MVPKASEQIPRVEVNSVYSSAQNCMFIRLNLSQLFCFVLFVSLPYEKIRKFGAKKSDATCIGLFSLTNQIEERDRFC